MFGGGYYGAIWISDGINGHSLQCDGNITIKSKKHDVTAVIESEGGRVRGHKYLHKGKLLEWERLGKFYRGYKTLHHQNIKGRVMLRYHPDSHRALHGISERYDQKLMGVPGKCRTMYSRGRLIWQEFRYETKWVGDNLCYGKVAYRFRRNDRTVTIKHPSGKVAAVISCPNGLAVSARYSGDDSAHVYQGRVYFMLERLKDKQEHRAHYFDYSKDGNSAFIVYDGKGRIKFKGEYKNHQRVGEYVWLGKTSYCLHGVPVSKKLYETKPEDLKVGQIIRLPNAQLRAALLAKIGPERIAKQSKYTTIHETKSGMKLMEFPIAVDDGNGSTLSRLRILQVRCPSTKGFYYLQVPDFVWDGGKKTKLNTCEQARQWTFGVDDPRKMIKFEKET